MEKLKNILSIGMEFTGAGGKEFEDHFTIEECIGELDYQLSTIILDMHCNGLELSEELTKYRSKLSEDLITEEDSGDTENIEASLYYLARVDKMIEELAVILKDSNGEL